MSTRTTLLSIGLSAAIAAVPAYAAGPRAGGQQAGSNLAALDAQEAATLTFMREEEKVARDMYLTLDELWSSPLFENISASEQQHMDAVASALAKYGLPDPAQPQIGAFTNPELQALYNLLLAQGEVSYLEALRVGGLIEEVDIEDNENAIAETDNADLQRVYGNLLRGSRNHLRAYAAEIERLGVVYEAQYLDQTVVDEIIDSPMERGGNR